MKILDKYGIAMFHNEREKKLYQNKIEIQSLINELRKQFK